MRRTLRHANIGMQGDLEDPSTLMRRGAQLLVGYRGGLVVGVRGVDEEGPAPGDRASLNAVFRA